MTDKSFVTMEQNQCFVCCEIFDTGALLLDCRMRERFERYTLTGTDFCPACQKLNDDGFIALVEVNPDKSIDNGGLMKSSEACRTGRIVHVRRSAASRIFDSETENHPMAFVEPGVFAALERMSS